MTVTFGGVTLQKPRIKEIRSHADTSKTDLNLGGVYIDSGTVTSREYDFKCYTASYTDITNLQALRGTNSGAGYDLVIGSTTVTNCMILGDIAITPTENYTAWFYEFTLAEDTRV